MSEIIAAHPVGTDMKGPSFSQLKGSVEARLTELVPEAGGPSRAARHSLLAPAKRLRAVLTQLSAGYCGGEHQGSLDTACAVEMIHTASLIFDDLPAMDNAALRRGKATSHVLYGDDVAILAGIGLLNGAYGVVSQCTSLSGDQKVSIIRILSDSVGWNGLVQGQALDLSSESHGAETSVDQIHYGKTGALFVAAALAGAEAAGCDGSRAVTLETYAQELGYAYQALDDVLDHVADDSIAGKSTGKDLGKMTAVSCHGRLAEARSLATSRLAKAKATALAGESDGTGLALFADAISAHFDKAISASTA